LHQGQTWDYAQAAAYCSSQVAGNVLASVTTQEEINFITGVFVGS
jgi:hypothetical protein